MENSRLSNNVISILEEQNRRMLQNKQHLKQASGGVYDPGNKHDIVFVQKDVYEQLMNAWVEVSVGGQKGGPNMDERLFKEIEEIKTMVTKTNDKIDETNKKVHEIDKNVFGLEERSKHTATKNFVMGTGVITVVTILGSIFSFANFFR